MLALTRRIGESVKIGDSVRLTVRHRIRELMLIDLTAPAGSRLTCENAPLTSMPTSSGLERYLCSVLAGERLNLGDVLIVFGSPRGARGNNRQILLRIDAPLEFAISREDARAEDPHHLEQAIRKGESIDLPGFFRPAELQNERVRPCPTVRSDTTA